MQRKKKGVWKSYAVTGLMTVLALSALLWSLKVFPFGDRTFLWTDSDQYLAFGQYLGSVIRGKNDLFYSWNSVLGGNALCQTAYYAASPFNVLYMLLYEHPLFTAQVITYAKILSASLSFFYCLSWLQRDGSFLMKSAFSVCYAFMGYMIFYGWNASWMDAVIALPILYIGIIKLIEGGRSLQYTLALAYAVIANCYTGFMLCIASFILYVAALLLRKDRFWKSVRESFLRYALFSLLGVGLGMFILLPAYLGVPNIRKLSLTEMLGNVFLNLRPSELLSGLFTGQRNTMWDNAPLIYVGIVPLFLAVLFFICKQAPMKKKLVYAALLVTVLLSFMNSFLNRFWHGLSNNSWFNFRYSFFASFILLLIACEGYTLVRKKQPSGPEYMKAGCILLAVALFVMDGASQKLDHSAVIADCAVVCLLVALLVRGYGEKRAFRAFAVALMLCGSVLNGFLCLKDCDFGSRLTFGEVRALMHDAENCIDDDSFYRMEKTINYTRCDGNLFDYKAASAIASTENLDNLLYLQKLGQQYFHPWGECYTTNLPEATEALLGLKYILSDTLNEKDYICIGSSGDIGFYRNSFALPILFPAETIEVSTRDRNDFDMMNTIWRSINGVERDVFVENDILAADDESAWEISVMRSGSVYVCIPHGSFTLLCVEGDTVQEEILYRWDNNGASEIYYIGEWEEGDSFRLSAEPFDEAYPCQAVTCYTEDKSVIAENAAIVNAFQTEIEELSSSHLVMTYDGSRKCIATTIPYDEGWTVYDNGRETPIRKNWDNFLSFTLDSEDTHEIELIYRPAGFRVGAAVSLLSFAVLLLYALWRFRSNRSQME